MSADIAARLGVSIDTVRRDPSRAQPTVEVDLLGGRVHRMTQTVTGGDVIAQLQALPRVPAVA